MSLHRLSYVGDYGMPYLVVKTSNKRFWSDGMPFYTSQQDADKFNPDGI
jgi:hypothetical protein